MKKRIPLKNKNLEYYADDELGLLYNSKGRELKTQMGNRGYLVIQINKKNYTVHRLVAMTFHDNPNNYKEINHINCIKTDNRASNVEWCTRSHNVLESYKNGCQISIKGEDRTDSILKDNQVRLIRLVGKQKTLTQGQIGDCFGVSRTTIFNILNNSKWKHVV